MVYISPVAPTPADIAAILADLATLLARLTAARAGYLDELAAANIPADIDTLLARLTALRAGYLDNLNNIQLLNIPDLSTLTAARISYLDNINQAGLLQVTAARAALLDQITALRLAELDAANLPADIDTLLARLTAARAGYLDELAAANIPTDLANIIAYVDDLETRLTAARAGYLDNINQAGLLQVTAARAGYLDNLIGTISVAGSPYSQPNDLVENDAIIVAAATQLVDIELDMSNLTQNNTVREYVQVDAANYRQISAKIFPTDFDTGTESVLITFPQKGVLYKITMQSVVLEGGVRDVPYRIITRDLS